MKSTLSQGRSHHTSQTLKRQGLLHVVVKRRSDPRWAPKARPSIMAEHVPVVAMGYMTPPRPREKPMLSDSRWMLLCCVALGGMIILSAYLSTLTPLTRGVETSWLAPSLCAARDTSHGRRYVSYVDGRSSYGYDGSYDAPNIGDACPTAEIIDSKPQDFVLPESLTWPPIGANVSLVVFRSNHDTITLSFELRDADGVLLLSESGVTFEADGDNAVLAATALTMNADGTVVVVSGSTADAAVLSKADESSESTAASARRLLKGGGRGGAVAVASGPHRYTNSHSMPPPSSGTRTAYGVHTAAAVRAGTLVALLHHPRGYGRPALCSSAPEQTGCEGVLREELARDGLRGAFTMTSGLKFPLTLSLAQLDVWRAAEGAPPAYLALYSPTGGAAVGGSAGALPWSERLLLWMTMPLLVSVLCCLRLLRLFERNRLFALFLTLALTAALQQLIAWFLASAF